jgi:hypothetical protein
MLPVGRISGGDRLGAYEVEILDLGRARQAPRSRTRTSYRPNSIRCSETARGGTTRKLPYVESRGQISTPVHLI